MKRAANLAMGRSHAWVLRGRESVEPRPMNWGDNLTRVGAIRRHVTSGWLWALARPACEGLDTKHGRRIELHDSLRDECLKEPWFTSLAHAQAVIDAWRRDTTRSDRRKDWAG
jgi:Integrase core domain